MTWRDDLRRVTITVDGKQRTLIGGSFRGVAFFVQSSERTGGRRVVIHEFPLSDTPFGEDLGARAETFRIEGYVIGADYVAQRDALRAALQDVEGPGELVDPYNGVLVAICTQMAIRESSQQGGFAAFSLEFAETPAQAPAPTTVVNLPDQVSDSADVATDATTTELVSVYDTTGMPAFALASAQTAITSAIASMKDRLAQVVTATQEAAQLTSQVALITAEAASLIRTPALILGRFHDALATLETTVLDAPGAVLKAFVAAYGSDLGPLTSATTSTRAKELANQVALQAAVRRFFAVEAARLAPTVPYASIDDAVAARDSIVAMLDAEVATAGDVAYPALVDLRSKLQQSVPGGKTFARVVTVTRNDTISSLLLTYQLYGSVDNEADVIARNKIKHPGFIAGELKVLSDG